MLFILKAALFLIPIVFLLFMTRVEAAAAPGAAAAGALILWWLEPKEPPRLVAYAVTVLSALVAAYKGAPLWLIASAIPLAGLFALEFIARRQRQDDPSSGSVLIVALLVGAAAIGCMRVGGRTDPIGSQIPKRIVAIGDSLTAGVGHDGLDQRWAELLAAEFDATLVNLSHPGDTLMSSWSRWESRIGRGRWKPGDRNWEPDLVILVLGGNDVLRQHGRAEVEKGLRHWAQALNNSGAEVLVVGVPGGAVTDPYAGAWEEVAREYGFAYMSDDALRRVFLNRSMTIDGIHMNASGHSYFADAVKRRIEGN